MSNKDLILKDIENHNDAHDMDFKKWVMWGITQIAVMTAMILDNVENINREQISEEEEL